MNQHLFSAELGNKGHYNTNGVYVGDGNWGLDNTEDFQNLISSVYWSGTGYAANTNYAWVFNFDDGYQYTRHKSNVYYALAVRDGDVAAVAGACDGSATWNWFGGDGGFWRKEEA